jgi:F0F1-type ATP synthase membrane subunit c/vacuolar-type H+-ATPase subunit K
MRLISAAILAALAILGSVRPAAAQANVATFDQTDVDFAVTGSYRLNFYQCASVDATGAGVSCAATAFGGMDIPKAQVSTVQSFSRTVNLHATGLTLPAFPAGVPFIAKIIANGDPAQGTVASGESAASNGFFGSPRPLVNLTNVRIR